MFGTGPEGKKRPKVWAVGGGKGGVGKSLVSANLSICLSLMGNKVTAIDLDLGGANLHTCLGVGVPEKTLSDYVEGKISSMEGLVTPTKIKNLSLISGAQDAMGMANLRQMQKNKILANLHEIDSDFVLVDLGAGTSVNTLDFFIAADNGILVVLPEPTSIENTYRFIKAIYFRRLKMIEELLEIQPLIEQAMNAKISSPGNAPTEFVRKIIEINPEMGMRLKNEISKIRLKLVVNQVRSQADIDIGFSIQSICKRYFGIEIEFIGYLDYDAAVWQSVKKRRPLLMEFPNSRLVNNFEKMIQRLLGIR